VYRFHRLHEFWDPAKQRLEKRPYWSATSALAKLGEIMP
jgi:hypothetical protein